MRAKLGALRLSATTREVHLDLDAGLPGLDGTWPSRPVAAELRPACLPQRGAQLCPGSCIEQMQVHKYVQENAA